MNPWDLVNWAAAIGSAVIVLAIFVGLSIIIVNTARRQK